MRLRENLVIKKIVGSNIIIPIGKALTEGIQMSELRDKELCLCKLLLKENVSEEKLVEEFLIHYQVTPEDAKEFVGNFLEECRSFNYIVENTI